MDLQNGILAKLCDAFGFNAKHIWITYGIYKLVRCLYNNMHLTVAAKSYKLLVKHIS